MKYLTAWEQMIHYWVMMNIRSEQGDQAITERLVTAMDHMERDDILVAFAEKAVPLLVEKGKDGLLPKGEVN